MSEAEPDVDDVDALLNEALRADVLALRHVNGQLLATTEPDVLNGYVRSQQRITRSLRTTLTTKAKLTRERDAEARRIAAEEPPEPPPAPVARPAPPSAPRYNPEQVLQTEITKQVRLEYDPAEADAIVYELDDLIDESWEEDGYNRMLPADRVTSLMALIRETFGPSKATPAPKPPEPKPAPKPKAKAAAEPPAAPPPAPEPPAAPAPEPPQGPEPYLPPWERRPPGAIDRGGGSGW